MTKEDNKKWWSLAGIKAKPRSQVSLREDLRLKSGQSPWLPISSHPVLFTTIDFGVIDLAHMLSI